MDYYLCSIHSDYIVSYFFLFLFQTLREKKNLLTFLFSINVPYSLACWELKPGIHHVNWAASYGFLTQENLTGFVSSTIFNYVSGIRVCVTETDFFFPSNSGEAQPRVIKSDSLTTAFPECLWEKFMLVEAKKSNASCIDTMENLPSVSGKSSDPSKQLNNHAHFNRSFDLEESQRLHLIGLYVKRVPKLVFWTHCVEVDIVSFCTC